VAAKECKCSEREDTGVVFERLLMLGFEIGRYKKSEGLGLKWKQII